MLYFPDRSRYKPSELISIKNLKRADEIIDDENFLKMSESPGVGYIRSDGITRNFVAPPEKLVKFYTTRNIEDVFPWYKKDSKKKFELHPILFTTDGYILTVPYTDGLYSILVPYDCEDCAYLYYDSVKGVPEEYVMDSIIEVPKMFDDADVIEGFITPDGPYFMVSSRDRSITIMKENKGYSVILHDDGKSYSATLPDISLLSMTKTIDELKFFLSFV